jgi:DNA-binding MarR family transcriptional regulator
MPESRENRCKIMAAASILPVTEGCELALTLDALSMRYNMVMAFSDNLGYMLQHTATSLSRQADQVLQERLGIGLSQFKIMMVLQWNPSVKQRDIANNLGQTEASISRQIKLMHDEGLLQTTVRPSNRRGHITSLTRKGEKLADEASGVLNQYHAPIFTRLDEKQQRQLGEIIGIMHSEICRGDRIGRCSQSYEG